MHPQASLLTAIERYIEAAELTPTTFGKQAAGDPTLVFDMKEGRELRSKTAAKIEAYMRDNPPKKVRAS